MINRLIVRHTIIDLSISSKQALIRKGRVIYTTNPLEIASMISGNRTAEKVIFLPGDSWESDNERDTWLGSMNLKFCDPHTLAKVNEDDPAFADDFPNMTYWEDGDHKYQITFCNWEGERQVGIFSSCSISSEGCWIATVSK